MINKVIKMAYDRAAEEEEDTGTLPEVQGVSPLTLRYFPDEILRKRCAPVTEVTDDVRKLAHDMILTMMLEGGVGLAAPQVGHLIRLVVVDIRWTEGLDYAEPHIFINPELVDIPEDAKKEPGREGCLSFPRGRATVERYPSITVKHLNGDGVPMVTLATGFFARAIQHEIDHLDGKTIQGVLSKFDLMNVRKRIDEKIRARRREVKAQHHHKT